jgi:hypothetical protein
VVFPLFALLIVNPELLAGSNPVPGRWEKVAKTKPGAKIRIFLKNGIMHDIGFLPWHYQTSFQSGSLPASVTYVLIDPPTLNFEFIPLGCPPRTDLLQMLYLITAGFNGRS